jgi:hypothetical protein
LLSDQFFRTKPLACDPSSLPKYPPSKEYDAKLRGKEAMRYAIIAMPNSCFFFFSLRPDLDCDRQAKRGGGHGRQGLSVD